jgi:hypothetical protein
LPRVSGRTMKRSMTFWQREISGGTTMSVTDIYVVDTDVLSFILK